MIEFARHPLKIAHINVREETHGEEDVLAVDLKLSFELPNTVLDFLSPTLRTSLFDAANDPDMLADQPLTIVRNPKLGTLRWSDTWRRMRLNLHGGNAKYDLAFNEVTIRRITMLPREGGTVVFGTQAQFRPGTEARTAKLLALLKREVPATLDASDATDSDDESEADE